MTEGPEVRASAGADVERPSHAGTAWADLDGAELDQRARAVFADSRTVREVVNFLTAERKRLGLTQVELARRIGISQPAVSDAEKGQTDPRLATLQRWARALGHQLDLELSESRFGTARSYSNRSIEYPDVISVEVKPASDDAGAWIAGRADPFADHTPVESGTVAGIRGIDDTNDSYINSLRNYLERDSN